MTEQKSLRFNKDTIVILIFFCEDAMALPSHSSELGAQQQQLQKKSISQFVSLLNSSGDEPANNIMIGHRGLSFLGFGLICRVNF